MKTFLPGVAPGASSMIDYDRVRSWMFDLALPFWAEHGVDRVHGGFLEELTPDGNATACEFKRVRVICRQIYVFSHAASLGWTPGAELAAIGYDYLVRHARRPDGGWARRLSRMGTAIDPTPDLYDLAFVIFAMSWCYKATGNAQALDLAYETLSYIQKNMTAPHGGFWHSLPPEGPRVQNPHMHLVEACHVAYDASGDRGFLAQADQLVELFRSRFFDGRTLGEFFAVNWTRDGTAAIEPGHQFEWAWILSNHARLAGAELDREILALVMFGEEFGVDPATQIVFDTVSCDGVIGGTARAWPTTERIKAWVALSRRKDLQPLERINGSLDLLFDKYFGDSAPGLWIDRFDARGEPMVSAVPASVLYHIFLAFAEVLRLAPLGTQRAD